MSRLATVAILLTALAGCCSAATAGASAPLPIPAATFSQFQCTGFIASEREPASVVVYNGADNDLYEALHSFTQGDLVYLRGEGGASFHPGEAFSIIRPETGFLLNYRWLPGMIQKEILPPASRYKLQRSKIKSLGFPYDNTGLVRVVKVTPQGAIAKVMFACTAINPQDIAVPYAPQPIPQYVPTARLSRFAPPNGKLQGVIVGASSASAYLAKGSIAFLNIGRDQGVAPGQRYRIFATFHDKVVMGLEGIKRAPETPRETLGELVILHVQGKAAEGIVVESLREIAIGDGVELE
ncbi:MAG: hypothetical protein KGM47_06890 [Acidobacteriota bacterium]|nr:hypothetical protein [Acidobacteriota bacterium]